MMRAAPALPLALFAGCPRPTPPPLFIDPPPPLLAPPELPPLAADPADCTVAVALQAGDEAPCLGVLLPRADLEALLHADEVAVPYLQQRLDIERAARLDDRRWCQLAHDDAWRAAAEARRDATASRWAVPVAAGAGVVVGASLAYLAVAPLLVLP